MAVQGISSHIDDLVLSSGRGVTLELGPGIVPEPKLTRTVEGASSIEIPVYDPDSTLLRATLLAEKWEAKLDGLRFRYAALSKSGKELTLTLEDRWIALLREKEGPKKAYRSKTTRAEFIKRLVEEACPGLKFHCPQLHRKQPIKNKEQGKKAKEEAKAKRGKGLGDTAGLKVKGVSPDAEQSDVIERALRVAESDSAPQRVQVALVAALIAESQAKNLHSGDGTSLGCLQIINTTAEAGNINPLDVEQSVDGFLTGYISEAYGAIAYYKAHPDASPAEIATNVQGNADGESSYAGFVSEAQEWVTEFGGGEGSLEVLEPFTFEVKKKEDYWSAIKRLAKEVNWRAFVVGETFFFMPEPELFAGMVRLAIDKDTPGIEDVDFEYDANQKKTDVTVTALVGSWGPPPGSVVTLADYGPASIGFGDAPVKGKKGQRVGISSARNAKTGEGRGRYLVSSIEVSLSDEAADRLATIQLRQPTNPLPEKESKTFSVSGLSAGASGNATVERVIEFLARETKSNPPYVWGGFDSSGYDCSGLVSKALNVGGWLEGRLDTKGLAVWGEAGKGELVTVYVNLTGDAHTEHTIIEVAGKFYQSGGGENDSASGGVDEFTPSDSYLAEFDTKRHPAGY